ncbi:MAG: hypothetical protein ACLTTJ_05730 [Blautia sp.]
MIICNWYMAYMCCLFSVLYFFSNYSVQERRKNMLYRLFNMG